MVNCDVCCPCACMSVWHKQLFVPSQTECVCSHKKKISNACGVRFFNVVLTVVVVVVVFLFVFFFLCVCVCVCVCVCTI